MRPEPPGALPLTLLAAGVFCGDGTHEARGRCLSDRLPLFCGPGTRGQGHECVPAVRSFACGEGTEERAHLCTPARGIVACGEGTRDDGQGACVVDEAWAPCGRGTVLVDGVCERGEDAALAHTYELRSPVLRIPADGVSKVPLQAYGRGADGEPSTAPVVIWADRPAAGA